MINLSGVVSNSPFAAPYTVLRRRGEWIKGRWEFSEPEILRYHGAVQPTSARELEQLPEGDRQRGTMTFFCTPPRKLYVSGDSNAISDEILFEGRKYKIISVKDWSRYGYIQAFAQLKDTPGD